MKETTRTIQVKAYTDEGKPVCGECVLLTTTGECQHSEEAFGEIPSGTCPVWHGESKGEWQPIETAPKDGTEYLACDESGKEQIVISQPPHHEKGFWEKDKDGRWCGSACNNNYHYWHHLPSPPQENNHER